VINKEAETHGRGWKKPTLGGGGRSKGRGGGGWPTVPEALLPGKKGEGGGGELAERSQRRGRFDTKKKKIFLGVEDVGEIFFAKGRTISQSPRTTYFFEKEKEKSGSRGGGARSTNR